MKKVLSLVLAVMLVVGMTTVAFAAADTEIDPAKLGLSLEDQPEGVTRPGTKFTFNITDGDGNLITIDRAYVRKHKIGVQIRATEGSAIIKDAKLKYDAVGSAGKAYVEVSIVDDYATTKEIDFSVQVYLTKNKSRLTGSQDGVDGTFENDFTEVFEGDDYVYLGDAPVAKAQDYIRDIKVDLGQGVSITTKMFDGKSYYGKVSQEIKSEDEKVLAQYPDIDTIYYLKTIGLASTGDVVAFDLESNFYAYTQDEDGNLVYVGRTNDKLAYYTKYFLSLKELEVEEVLEEDGEDLLEPGEDLTEPAPDELGGDDGAPANVNDNPATGR